MVSSWMIRVLRKCVRMLIKVIQSIVCVFTYISQAILLLLALCMGSLLAMIHLDLLGWWVYWAYVVGALINMVVFIRTTDDSDRVDFGWWLALPLIVLAWDLIIPVTLLVAICTKLDNWWVEIKEWCEHDG